MLNKSDSFPPSLSALVMLEDTYDNVFIFLSSDSHKSKSLISVVSLSGCASVCLYVCMFVT